MILTRKVETFVATFIISLISVIIYAVRPSSSYHHHIHEPAKTEVIQELVLPPVNVPNLHHDHYQFWIKNNPRALENFKKVCAQVKKNDLLQISSIEQFKLLHSNLTLEDSQYFNDLSYGKNLLSKICSKIDIIAKSCWGYENECHLIHLMPDCSGPTRGRVRDEHEQRIAWFKQADFGYILDRRRELVRYCAPDKYANHSIKSSLECTNHFRMCRGENMIIKFKSIPKGSTMITSDYQPLFARGDIGGWNCDLQLKRIAEQHQQRGVLQSWFNELEQYYLMQSNDKCDITIDKPVYLLKLDSASNMYHYVTSFFNLYATNHLTNRFSDDNQIIVWDNHVPKSDLNVLWSAFSRNVPKHIGQFENKRVCFKRFTFALLPRMVDGLYYNTDLVPGCSKSGLFDAFNKHVLHRLRIRQHYDSHLHKKSDNNLIRVTILMRKTLHRRILNENELKSALSALSSNYSVRLVDYAGMNFLQQLKITQNSDILIGIHGAGLTHVLFLPDWASVIEVHDCGDKCYYDLARLRGVSYFSTDNKHNLVTRKQPVDDDVELERLRKNKLADNEKFMNYEVSIEDMIRQFELAVVRVKKNRAEKLANQDRNIEEETNQTSSDHSSVGAAPTVAMRTSTTPSPSIRSASTGAATDHSMDSPVISHRTTIHPTGNQHVEL